MNSLPERAMESPVLTFHRPRSPCIQEALSSVTLVLLDLVVPELTAKVDMIYEKVLYNELGIAYGSRQYSRPLGMPSLPFTN